MSIHKDSFCSIGCDAPTAIERIAIFDYLLFISHIEPAPAEIIQAQRVTLFRPIVLMPGFQNNVTGAVGTVDRFRCRIKELSKNNAAAIVANVKKTTFIGSCRCRRKFRLP